MRYTLAVVLNLLFFTTGSAVAQISGSGASATMLHPGDILKVEVWREEDLSGEFLIDESGAVTLPLLGRRQAANVPFTELKAELLSAYHAELRNPSITITPLRRVYVLGEVQTPGLYTVDPTVSLAGAVALAGGASQQGDLKRLRVIRDGNVVLNGVPAESALGRINVLSGDQIFVGRRSWFDRNSTFVVSVLLSLTSIVITLAR